MATFGPLPHPLSKWALASIYDYCGFVEIALLILACSVLALQTWAGLSSLSLLYLLASTLGPVFANVGCGFVFLSFACALVLVCFLLSLSFLLFVSLSSFLFAFFLSLASVACSLSFFLLL